MRRWAAILGVVAVLLVGCGTRVQPSIGTPGPSPAPSASVGASITAAPPSASPSAAPSASASVAPSATASGSPAPSPTTAGSPSPSESAAPSATVGPSATPAADLPQGDEPVTLDPANFVAMIDNPWWPMTPGSEWRYSEVDLEGGEAEVDVTVTGETRVIAGITAIVVHDIVTEDGEVIEDTFDWYAQDRDGNIWYMGEDTREFENGEIVSTAGSWEHGVDGAMAGILLPANPFPGLTYRQEYYAGEAEDTAEVLSVTEWVEVEFGSFENVLMTKDFTPLEPDILEHKFYAQGVGPVLVLAISGGSDREELIDFNPAGE